MVQTSSKNATIFVWVTLVITFITYGRFVSLVIQDITNYLGIACFTVGKKDKKGDGYSEQPNTNNKQL
jgi:ethanolaminephosphotransferase